jgi:hypothetical protein
MRVVFRPGHQHERIGKALVGKGLVHGVARTSCME